MGIHGDPWGSKIDSDGFRWDPWDPWGFRWVQMGPWGSMAVHGGPDGSMAVHGGHCPWRSMAVHGDPRIRTGRVGRPIRGFHHGIPRLRAGVARFWALFKVGETERNGGTLFLKGFLFLFFPPIFKKVFFIRSPHNSTSAGHAHQHSASPQRPHTSHTGTAAHSRPPPSASPRATASTGTSSPCTPHTPPSHTSHRSGGGGREEVRGVVGAEHERGTRGGGSASWGMGGVCAVRGGGGGG